MTAKIYAVLWIAIAAAGVTGMYNVYALVISVRHMNLTREVELEMLSCRRYEMDFVATEDTNLLDKHAAAFERVAGGARRLEVAIPDVSVLRHLEIYRLAFQDMVKAMTEVGLSEEDGLRGRLRASIHDVEEALQGRDDLVNLVLMCRRHEKDFIIRNKEVNVERFERSADELLRAVLMTDLAAGGQFLIPDMIVTYRESFRSLVDRMVEVGLDEGQGLRGKMRDAVDQTNAIFAQLHRLAEVERQRTLRSSIGVAGVMVALMGIAAGLLVSARRKVVALHTEAAPRPEAVDGGN